MFGNAGDAVEMGAIAQRRRKGDRHELNALRTWASAVRPPEPPDTLLLPQTLTLTAKHGTFVARQRNAGSFQRFRPRIKKNGFRTRAFRPFRDLSWKLFIPALMGGRRARLWAGIAGRGGALGPTPMPPKRRHRTSREGEVWRRVGLE
jgi:hypothetical protein